MTDVKELRDLIERLRELAEGASAYAARLGFKSTEGNALMEAASALQSLVERNEKMEEALRGVMKRIDHPGNNVQRVMYFRRWPEVEAARSALPPEAVEP